MAEYCVNILSQANGDHEVHNLLTCTRLPHPAHRLLLGYYPTCLGALLQARRIYPTANGCAWCSLHCNTG